MAKRDDKKEEQLWRQAAAGNVHSLARLLNEHYDNVLANLKKLNRLQTMAANIVQEALDDAIVDLLLTQPEVSHPGGIGATWYDLAKVLATRREKGGRQARGEALERLAQAKAEAARLRQEREEAQRQKARATGKKYFKPSSQFRMRKKNAAQMFLSGASQASMSRWNQMAVKESM